MGVSLLGCGAVNLAGLICGIVGAVVPGRNKLFAWLGIGLNAFLAFGLCGLMAMGLMAMAAGL